MPLAMSAESSARILNARLANARDDRELADIVNNAGGGAVDDFNEIHVTTAVGRLARLTARRKTTTLTWRQRDDVLALLEERLKTLDSIRARNVANLLWSYAKLKYPGNHSVVQCVSDHVLRVVDDFKAMDMANTVWAWATLRYQASDDVLAAMERRMLACLDDFKPQELANTVWAVAMLMNNIEGDKITIDQDVLDRLLHQLEAIEFRSVEEHSLQQIFHAHHLLGDRFKPSVALLDQAREAWAKSTLACASSSSRSSLEREVIACLDRLGITYDVEALTEDGMHCVDMLVRGRTDDGGERLLAIECDGPTHFMRDSDGKYRIDGSTYARNCDLRKLGLGVLSVARHEWIRLKKDERDAYLSRELQERGIVVFSR